MAFFQKSDKNFIDSTPAGDNSADKLINESADIGIEDPYPNQIQKMTPVNAMPTPGMQSKPLKKLQMVSKNDRISIVNEDP